MIEDTINCSLFEEVVIMNHVFKAHENSSDEEASFFIKMSKAKTQLWILHHFNHLEIEVIKIYYRKQSKNPKQLNPQIKLRKTFNKTCELLTYLSTKKYNLNYWKIVFKNGWSLEHLYNTYTFSCNNKTERNNLLNRILLISGIEVNKHQNFKHGERYLINLDGTFTQVDILSIY